MSGPSTYNPKSGIEKWLDAPAVAAPDARHDAYLPDAQESEFLVHVRRHLTFCLGVQIITGIVLAMHYVATAGLAFDSVEKIMRDVNYGWLIRYVHANGASMFFLAVYIHMFRGIYYGSYKAPREVDLDPGRPDLPADDRHRPSSATSCPGARCPSGVPPSSPTCSAPFPMIGPGIATWLWGDSRSATPP